MDAIKAYKKRREARIKSRMDGVRWDDEEGRWVTTEKKHKIHFNEQGEPDKGNPHVLAAMKGESKKPRKVGGSEIIVGADKNKPFAEIEPNNSELEKWAEKKGYKAKWVDPAVGKDGKKIMDGHFAYSDKYGRTVSPKDIQDAFGKEIGGGKKTGNKGESGGSYERIPVSYLMGGSKYATPEERKQVRETVSRFMNEAKNGDVYVAGHGIGETGTNRFRVTTRRGKPALEWVDENGRGNGRAVEMNRANVLKYLGNGAKLEKRG